MTAGKNENQYRGEILSQSGQNPKHLDIVNSSGNHTVNNLHSFSVVFIDFDREDLNFQDFCKNISNPTRSSAFFMYTVFFGFLAESEGLSGDLVLRHFANNYQVPSAKSGSGEPPDRAQICSYDDDDAI